MTEIDKRETDETEISRIFKMWMVGPCPCLLRCYDDRQWNSFKISSRDTEKFD